MRQRRRKRILITFSLLTAATLLLLGLNIGIGSVKIPAKDIWMLMQGKEIANSRIVMDIRLPRTFAALVLGGALALSGYLLQTFSEIPLQALLFWEFPPEQNGGGSCHDLSDRQIGESQLRGNDPGSFCWRYDFHGICIASFQKGKQYVHAGGKRCDDRVYMLCDHRVCRHLCK